MIARHLEASQLCPSVNPNGLYATGRSILFTGGFPHCWDKLVFKNLMFGFTWLKIALNELPSLFTARVLVVICLVPEVCLLSYRVTLPRCPFTNIVR